MPGFVYDTYGLVDSAGEPITDFSADVVLERVPLFVWVEITTQGVARVLDCELLGNAEGTATAFNIVQTREYPFRIRKILSTTTISKLIPLYGGPE